MSAPKIFFAVCNPDLYHSSMQFEAALRRFDEENAKDPHIEVVDGFPKPATLVYAQRLYDWVLKLAPNASQELLLAARSQHICRWMIPRKEYPMDRIGYLRWRNDLKKFHAKKSGEILHELGFSEVTIARVQALNLKKDFPKDPESRVLEDALCLVFLEHQFADLAARTPEDKMINALQKTWKKMTPAAHEHALRLQYTPREKALLDRALAESH
jgi:Domain of unknown function (DUF4202)